MCIFLIYRQIIRLKGKVYRINGMADHVHILAYFPANQALSEIVRVIKQETSKSIGDFIPHWEGWQEGYGCFTCSFREKDSVIQYIINQQTHHKNESFISEYQRMLIENGFSKDDPYFPE